VKKSTRLISETGLPINVSMNRNESPNDSTMRRYSAARGDFDMNPAPNTPGDAGPQTRRPPASG
jgi:hypothetical protein